MKELKPTLPQKMNNKRYFDPFKNEHGEKFPVCCCGFELIKQDDNIWECTGGSSHRYIMDFGDMVKDKFGNLLFKVPEDQQNKPGPGVTK